MDKLFLQIINMSITSSYIILIIMIIRLFLKKAPKIFSYVLWMIPFIRLTFPFSIESIFSIISINTETIPKDIILNQTPQIQSGITAIDSTVNRVLPIPDVGASVNPMQIWISIGIVIWIAGIIILIVYSVYSTLKLSRNLKSANLLSGNIYRIETIETPFVFGLIKPKIYLPDNLSETEKSYIIKHEQTHIKRFDHIIKFAAFLIVSIHWFNPLVWIAYYLMGEDMELSCDESVIKEMGYGIKKDYSNSLLSLSTGRRIIGGSPIAFGENNTKGRIKNILNYKNPSFWMAVVAVIIVVAVCVGLLTNPVKSGVIMVNDILYRQNGQRLNYFPSDVYEIGSLESILHNRNEVPERNFQGAMLDEKYAGNLLYQNKTGDIIYLEDFSGYYIVFVANEVPQDLSDRRPMIMVNGQLYLDTGRQMSVEIDESAIIDEISSSVDQSEKPTEDGQTNFGNIGAKYAYFEDNIVVLLNNEWVLFEKESETVKVEIFLDKEIDGMYEEITIKTKDNQKTFPWINVTNPTYLPIKYVADVDNDTKDEIIILLTTGYGTGIYVQDIHILNLEDLTEIHIEDPIESINNTFSSSIVADGNKVNVEIKWEDKTLKKTYDESYTVNWFEKISFGSHVYYEVIDNKIISRVSGAVSHSHFPFSVILEYDENLKVINIEVFDNEAVIDTVDKTYSISYGKISAYLKEECTRVYSPYYEILDFIISDYQEEVVNENVEAVFQYKMINKNYDRDPDTVEYIKEAKEQGDKNYQIYYDEYLQPQEHNFYFKAVIDKNNVINLYTRNPAIESDQWQQVEISDYIIH